MPTQNQNDEAVKIVNALKPVIKGWVEEWDRNAVRAKKMTVKTAPNGTTMGVVDAFSNAVMNIPYSIGLAGSSVGDTVWCIWMGNNMQTLVAMWTGTLGIGSIGGGGDLPIGGSANDVLINLGSDIASWQAPASVAEADNMRPITSDAVYDIVGDINTLLSNI